MPATGTLGSLSAFPLPMHARTETGCQLLPGSRMQLETSEVRTTPLQTHAFSLDLCSPCVLPTTCTRSSKIDLSGDISVAAPVTNLQPPLTMVRPRLRRKCCRGFSRRSRHIIPVTPLPNVG